MITTARKGIAAAVLVSVSLAACGGGDDDADTSSDETTTTAAAADETSTTAGPGESGLAALDTFIIGWNAENTAGGNTVDAWVSTPISKDAVVQQASDGGGEVFAVRLNDGAVLGGRIEDGSVSSVFVGVDPDNEATASVVQMALMYHLDDEAEIMTLAPKYRDVALATEARSDYALAGTEDAFVFSLIEGAEAGDRLVAISMSELTDEAAARDRAAKDQTDVLTLLGTTE